jgi:hypothetical protein
MTIVISTHLVRPYMHDGKILRVKFKPGVAPQKRFEGVVRILTDLIEDGMRDEKVRLKAVAIVNAAGVRGHDELGEIKAIVKWVQRNMIYRKDAFGVEFFHTASRLIRDIESGQSAGDCDDFVILGGALLGSLGYPVGALIVDSNNDGVFNHVMLVTKTFGPTKQFGRNWIPCELIYPEFKIGQSVPISRVYPLMADAQTMRAPVMTSDSIRGISGLGMSRKEIADKHPADTSSHHIDVMKTNMDRGMAFKQAHDAANRAGFLPKEEVKNCGCGQYPCKTYGYKGGAKKPESATQSALGSLINAHPVVRMLGNLMR